MFQANNRRSIIHFNQQLVNISKRLDNWISAVKEVQLSKKIQKFNGSEVECEDLAQIEANIQTLQRQIEKVSIYWFI